jgi:hypothetical protein
VSLTVLATYLILTFPGFVNDNSFFDYDDWLTTTYAKVYFCTDMLWLLLTLVSVVIIAVAIGSLLQTISKLNLGPSVNIDKFNLILHQCMLTVLVLVVVTASIPYRVLPNLYFKFEVALVYADLVN